MKMAKRYVRRKIQLKIILAILVIVLLPLLFVSCISMFTLFIAGGDEIEMAKSFDIPHGFLKDAYNRVEDYNDEVKKNKDKIDFLDVLVYSAGEANLQMEDYTGEVLKIAMNRAIAEDKKSKLEEYIEEVLSKYLEDIETGPIPEKKIEKYKDEYIDPETGEEKTKTKKKITEYTYSSIDDFGADRSYGGERRHLGNDIMCDMGTPIVSMTDGVVDKMGWDELGGWRIGILTKKDTYFYYAHMSEYEENIEIGDKVRAEDVIGYVGDSGYGPMGTTGEFEPQLHLQIGIKLNENDDSFTWINPYNIVKFMDDFRTVLGEDDDD